MAAARWFQLLTTAFFTGALASVANAGTLHVLYTFRGYPARDGANPEAAPIMDTKGDLFGTTSAGGSSACGTVYRLHKTQSGAWKETILYTFQCGDDGYSPIGGVIMDNAGDLYGDTVFGGTGDCYFFGGRIGCGTVYKMSHGKGGAWTETVLYSFPAPNGGFFDGPYASLAFDKTGTLYGTTVFDSECAGVSRGSVFRLKQVGVGWKERQIHQFCDPGHGGRSPAYGALVFDPTGNIYGTTLGGGRGDDYGVVFELTASAGSRWQFSKLHQFTPEEGGALQAGVILDAAGNLYGAEFTGQYGNGSIFELSPGTRGGWKMNILHVFAGGLDGVGPWQTPVFDSSGNLFGTTQGGGEAQYCVNCGVIYELVPQAGDQWIESVVYSFGSQLNVTDGSDPIGGLVRGRDGNFYGTTYESGDSSCGGCGAVYEFTP